MEEVNTFGAAEDDVSHHLFGSEEGLHYRRGFAALVQRHAADWRHMQWIRQEGKRQLTEF